MWRFSLSLQAGILKCRGKPTVILKRHVLKGTSCSKIKNRLSYKFTSSYQCSQTSVGSSSWVVSHFVISLLLFFLFVCCFWLFLIFFLLCFQVYWSCGSSSWKVIGDGQFCIVMVPLQHSWIRGDKSLWKRSSSLSGIQDTDLNPVNIMKVERNLCPCRILYYSLRHQFWNFVICGSLTFSHEHMNPITMNLSLIE